MKNSIPLKKIIKPPELPKTRSRKLTIPDINILSSQADPKQSSPSDTNPKDPLIPKSQEPYFLSKGFTKPFQSNNNNSKSKGTMSFSRVKPPSMYYYPSSSYRNPLSKSTAYVSNNFLSPSGFISSQRSHNDSLSKNPHKSELLSKLTVITTGKKNPKTIKKETSIESYANPFLTDRAKVNKMKKKYMLITRPQPQRTPRRKESSEKPSFLLSVEIPEKQAISIEKQPSKLLVERISHKNISINDNNAMGGLTVIQLSNASKASDNQARSPLLTPTHRMAISPLDSFSKKINHRRSDLGFNPNFRKNMDTKKYIAILLYS